MSDTRRPSERMADAAIAVARHAARLGLGPDEDLAEALPGAVAAALDERDALREEVARLRPLLGEALYAVPCMALGGAPKPHSHDDWYALMDDIVVALHGPRGDDTEDRPCCVECGCSVRIYTAVERGGEWYCAQCLNGTERLPDEAEVARRAAENQRLRELLGRRVEGVRLAVVLCAAADGGGWGEGWVQLASDIEDALAAAEEEGEGA